MSKINELAKCRQAQRMDRGPWPNEEAKKYAARELAEELSDAFAFGEQLPPHALNEIMLYKLSAIFSLLENAHPEGVKQAFDATMDKHA